MTHASLFFKRLNTVLVKRSINLSGHATSLALEPEFWAVLGRMAEGRSLAAMIGEIDDARAGRPLASACRVAALNWMSTVR
jgi:predicted DNA-binding ribbon-helix-helix protein